MVKQEGPTFRLTASCFNCAHKISEGYTCQSDSGTDVYCGHPDIGKKLVGDTSWDTPDFCPFLKDKLQEFLNERLLK